MKHFLLPHNNDHFLICDHIDNNFIVFVITKITKIININLNLYNLPLMLLIFNYSKILISVNYVIL